MLRIFTTSRYGLYEKLFTPLGNTFPIHRWTRLFRSVENLEGETNYRFLKAKVAQQTLRRVDKNFKSFFKASQDFKNNPKKYFGKPRPPHFKQKLYSNLVYD